jgi:copper chaperone CopZ
MHYLCIMKYTYTIEGMTCSSCVQKVEEAFQKVNGVKGVAVNLPTKTAVVEASSEVSETFLRDALKKTKYKIEEIVEPEEEKSSIVKTYAPLLLVVAFITGVALLTSLKSGNVQIGIFMNHFMAGFFLVFSFFKFLNLKAFAESYAMYDVLAKKLPAYGFVYPFLELILGICFLTGFNPFITNLATVVLMGFSSIGVIQSVLDKRKIRCACLGAVFNLPMSSITIAEDLLMVAMGVTMLVI